MGTAAIQAVRRGVNDQCQALAQNVESSGAFLARRGAAFRGTTLPPPEQWTELLMPCFRTRRGLTQGQYRCCAFAQAQLACMAMRGEDTAHLFPDDNPAEPQVWPLLRCTFEVQFLYVASVRACAARFLIRGHDNGVLRAIPSISSLLTNSKLRGGNHCEYSQSGFGMARLVHRSACFVVCTRCLRVRPGLTQCQ